MSKYGPHGARAERELSAEVPVRKQSSMGIGKTDASLDQLLAPTLPRVRCGAAVLRTPDPR